MPNNLCYILLYCVICHIILSLPDYKIIDNQFCKEQKDGEYLSLLEARKACDLDAACSMFYDLESQNKRYLLCGYGGEIQSSPIFRSRLYTKNYIECKSALK